MKTRHATAALALALAVPLAACDVDQTEEGEMPEIEVESEGELPEYEVEGPDVDISTDTTTIRTPDVDVNPPGEGGEGGTDEGGGPY